MHYVITCYDNQVVLILGIIYVYDYFLYDHNENTPYEESLNMALKHNIVRRNTWKIDFVSHKTIRNIAGGLLELDV